MLRTKVKASAVTNLTDARYFAAREVEWIGFCMDPASEGYLPLQAVQAIREWVDGVKITGEFHLQTAAEIRDALRELAFDAVQVGMFTDIDTLIELGSPVPVIKEYVVQKNTTEDQLAEFFNVFGPHAGMFLLNFDSGGIRWDDLANKRGPVAPDYLWQLCHAHPILLSMELTPTELAEAMKAISPLGFNFRGGAEEKPGFKSFDELDELFDALEI